jgi:uncharacterized SAM-binding protein YcdF (DUF218 family)
VEGEESELPSTLEAKKPRRKIKVRVTGIPGIGGRRPITPDASRRGLGLLRLTWRGKLVLSFVAEALVVLGWAAVARQLAPDSNTSLNRFDAIIVLGSPTDSDGNPTPTQLARVTEAVREYERGIAPRLILSGGPVQNHFVEAEAMARSAHALGIPESALFLESKAWSTTQNARYSVAIMRSHGWRSAEVISSQAHLPRAAMVFARLPIEWRTHAAPPLEPESGSDVFARNADETIKTARYLVWNRWVEPWQP